MKLAMRVVDSVRDRVMRKWLNVPASASETIKKKLAVVGANVQLAPDLKLDWPERVEIGDWVYVGPEGQFFTRGGLVVEDHTIIGPRVTIMTAMHNFRNAKYVPYDEIELLAPVRIGAANWIGFGVLLMPGITLGKGCIVGAGAVVTKSFAKGSILAGNPAKIIGQRDLEHLDSCLSSGRTYLAVKATLDLEKIEHPGPATAP